MSSRLAQHIFLSFGSQHQWLHYLVQLHLFILFLRSKKKNIMSKYERMWNIREKGKGKRKKKLNLTHFTEGNWDKKACECLIGNIFEAYLTNLVFKQLTLINIFQYLFLYIILLKKPCENHSKFPPWNS